MTACSPVGSGDNREMRKDGGVPETGGCASGAREAAKVPRENRLQTQVDATDDDDDQGRAGSGTDIDASFTGVRP
jgi:hypothetical protein